MGNITVIRKASPSDLKEIMEVERNGFPPNLQADRQTLAKRIKLFPQGFFVLLWQGKIVGFSTALIIDEVNSVKDLEPSDEDLHNPQGDTYYLRSLVISQEYQKLGFGQKLIKRHLANAKKFGKKKIRLTCVRKVAPYWRKMGFSQIAPYHNLHGNQESLWKVKV